MMNEGTSQRCSRHTKNLWTRCKGLTSKSEKLARIKLKEREIKERKRAFGLEYFNLEKKNGVTIEELQTCIQTAKSAIDNLELEMESLWMNMARIDEKTQKKIAKRNSKVPQQPRSRPVPTETKAPRIESNPFDPLEKDCLVVLPPPSAPSEELLFSHESH